MIIVYTGLPGSGKTTKLARLAHQKLKDARSFHKRHNFVRKLYTNIRFSPAIEQEFSTYIEYFDDIYEIHKWKDCDIFIDEAAVYFDAHDWERLPKRIKRYLRLHRHYDVNIYAAAQDFDTVDISFRRLTAHLFFIHKVISTREPSPHKKPIRFPFSFSIQREVKKEHYGIPKENYEFISTEFLFFRGRDFAIFDTRQELPEIPLPPLIKQVRICPEDGKQIVKYI